MILCWQAAGAAMSSNLIARITISHNGESWIGFSCLETNSVSAILIVL